MDQNTRNLLSVVVPCYNDMQCLDEVLDRVRTACEGCVDDFQLILVDDGSDDGSWEKIESLAAREPHITGVCLTRNFGQERALLAGLRHCTGDLVLLLDADLQDPPELLPQMLRGIERGADVVYGQRQSRRGESSLKKLTAWSYYVLFNAIAEIEIPRNVGYFRLMTRQVADAIVNLPQQPYFLRGVGAWVGYRQEPLRYVRDPRTVGTSGWPMKRMLQLATQGVVSFSTLPLRLPLYLAIGCAIALLLVASTSQVREALVSDGASMIVLLSLATVNFLVLGIFGLYLARIHQNNSRMPPYLVRTVVNAPRNRHVKHKGYENAEIETGLHAH